MSFRSTLRLLPPPSRRPRNTACRQAAIERLEDRTLLAGMWSDGVPSEIVSFDRPTGLYTSSSDVALAEDGHSVVTWAERDDSSGESKILFRRFGANGAPLGAAQTVVVSTALGYSSPAVDMADDGRFVIVYVANPVQSRTSTHLEVFRFSADGAPLQGPIPTAFSTGDDDGPYDPLVAVADDGRFVIGWTEVASRIDLSVGYQVFEADGDAVTPTMYVEGRVDYIVQSDGELAMNPVTGDFTIVYRRNDWRNDGPDELIRRVYRADGSAWLGPRRIHAEDDGAPGDPAVAMNAAGDVFYAWRSNTSFDSEGNPSEGVRLGAENLYGTSPLIGSAPIVVAFLPGEENLRDVQIVAAERRDTFAVMWIDHAGVGYRQYNLASNVDGEPDRHVPEPADAAFAAVAADMNARGDYVVAMEANFSGMRTTYTASHRFQPFDQVGVFRDGIWTLDVDGSRHEGRNDVSFAYGLAGDSPVTGDWDGDGLTEVGVFRNGMWYLDSNANRQFDAGDAVFAYGLAGDVPVVGDWNGDGVDDVGVFRPGTAQWFLDADRSFNFSAADAVFTFGSPGDVPVIGDFYNEGRPLWTVFRNGVWFVDLNRNGVWDGIATDHMFSLGSSGGQPVVGNWITPDIAARTGHDQLGVVRDGTWYLDTDGDGMLEPLDQPFPFGEAGDRPVRGAWSLIAFKNAAALPLQRIFPHRHEIGVFRNGTWAIDVNGNGRFDSASDAVFAYGLPGDVAFSADFDGDGSDEIGVYRDGVLYLDRNGNRQFDPDEASLFGEPGDRLVVGDWDGDRRDELGVFRDGVWHIDMNRNGLDAGDLVFTFGVAGDIPVVGDWNGDGRDEAGIFSAGGWTLDYDANRAVGLGDVFFGYGLAGDQAVVGDWNGDGFDDVGVFRNGLWSLDRNGSRNFDDLDWIFAYGDAGDLAVTGRWRVV